MESRLRWQLKTNGLVEVKVHVVKNWLTIDQKCSKILRGCLIKYLNHLTFANQKLDISIENCAYFIFSER
ncbi:MAG: hypothetical protein HC817_16260 [Saprospiraceae bacterium]|nr:hypothetical protein [Saprospiraceae bacterium]